MQPEQAARAQHCGAATHAVAKDRRALGPDVLRPVDMAECGLDVRDDSAVPEAGAALIAILDPGVMVKHVRHGGDVAGRGQALDPVLRETVEAGDVARLDASLQYRLLPRQFNGGLPDFLYAVIETNLVHQQKNRLNGSEDPNSGGTRLFLTPGLQYVTKRWIAEAAVQLPVSQNLNGSALESDYVARLSFRFNF